MAQATCEWTHDALAAAIRLPCVVRQEVVFEDNGGVEKGEVWRIAAVPGGTKGAQSFHVLLRHRLLPQPDGLEGVGSIREPLVAGDLSLAERGDDPIVDLDVCAACPAASLLPLMAQDFVAAGVHILDAGAPEAESLDDVPIELPSSLASANRPSVRPVSDRGDLVILGQQGEPGSPIAPVEVVHMSTDDLHVLLRHRLLPQPHGFEGLVKRPEPPHARHLPRLDRPQPVMRLLDSDSAFSPAPSRRHDRYHLVGGLDQLLTLVPDLRP